ncbi:MAG: GNAT family N-acetyltransferase, partial [Muribaculaceae bacterium]|nr:GNAT family N-acetyltransferase [Muribaculaceae bacterium]
LRQSVRAYLFMSLPFLSLTGAVFVQTDQVDLLMKHRDAAFKTAKLTRALVEKICVGYHARVFRRNIPRLHRLPLHVGDLERIQLVVRYDTTDGIGGRTGEKDCGQSRGAIVESLVVGNDSRRRRIGRALHYDTVERLARQGGHKLELAVVVDPRHKPRGRERILVFK